MALIVEDGTGLANSESYVSLAEALAYHDSVGNNDWLKKTPTLQEQALRRATQYIDNVYRTKFPGYKYRLRLQALEWPRYDAFDANGDYVPFDAVPLEVKRATFEAALREAVTPGYLTPDVTPSESLQSLTVGPVSLVYNQKGSAVSNARPAIPLIDEILGALIGSRGKIYTGMAVRG